MDSLPGRHGTKPHKDHFAPERDDKHGPTSTFFTVPRDPNPLWLQRRRQNYANPGGSPIYRLSEDLLLLIILDYIPDPETRHVLWFTSSLFMRLMSTISDALAAMPLPPIGHRNPNLPQDRHEQYYILRGTKHLSNPFWPPDINHLSVDDQDVVVRRLHRKVWYDWFYMVDNGRKLSKEIEEWQWKRIVGAVGDTTIWRGPSTAIDALVTTQDLSAGPHITARTEYMSLKLRERRERHQYVLRALLYRDAKHQYCERCTNGKQHTPEKMGLWNDGMASTNFCKRCGEPHPLPCFNHRQKAALAACRSRYHRLDLMAHSGIDLSREQPKYEPCQTCRTEHGFQFQAFKLTVPGVIKTKTKAEKKGSSHNQRRVDPTTKKTSTSKKKWLGSGSYFGIPPREGKQTDAFSTSFCVSETAKVNICPHVALTFHQVKDCIATNFGDDVGIRMIRMRSTLGWSSSETRDALRRRLDLLRLVGAECGCSTADENTRRIVRARLSSDLCQLRIASRTKAFHLATLSCRDGGVSLERIKKWVLDKENEEMMQGIFCPHVRLHDGRLLLPFEQNQCACFDRYTTDKDGKSVIVGPVSEGHLSTVAHDHGEERNLDTDWTEVTGGPCCRCRSSENNHRTEGEFMPRRTSADDDNRTAADGTAWGSAFDFLQPSTGHNYTCRTCKMLYSWTRDTEGIVYLQTYVAIDLGRGKTKTPDDFRNSAWIQDWAKHSDPESWAPDIQDDQPSRPKPKGKLRGLMGRAGKLKNMVDTTESPGVGSTGKPDGEKDKQTGEDEDQHAYLYRCPTLGCPAGESRMAWLSEYIERAPVYHDEDEEEN